MLIIKKITKGRLIEIPNNYLINISYEELRCLADKVVF